MRSRREGGSGTSRRTLHMRNASSLWCGEPWFGVSRPFFSLLHWVSQLAMLSVALPNCGFALPGFALRVVGYEAAVGS